MSLDGDGVVLSSLRRRDGWLEARVVAERPDPVRAMLRGSFREVVEVDLLGQPLGTPTTIAGAAHLERSAWEIRTPRLR